MPTNAEMHAMQAATLFKLLMLKQDVDKAGKTFEKLNALISETKVTMSKESIALVEKEVEQYK